jgi:hypothetical protein
MTHTESDPAAHVQVAAIYFPSWHVDERRDAHLGRDFTEWDLVQAGRPRFPGHAQPIVPADGYRDETEPEVMRDHVTRAGAAGIDAFLWDWYWYDERDFLNAPLDATYLGLDEHPVSFALMWANHTWIDVFPARVGRVGDTWWQGEVDAGQFDRMIDVVIERYLRHPAYWRVQGRAWFTVFSLETFVAGLGGVTQARDALARFRERARTQGAGELHLNVLGGYDGFSPEQVAQIGFDSLGVYGWADHMPLDRGATIDYASWREGAEARRAMEQRRQVVDVIPNVTMGWDSTTRVHQDDPHTQTKWPHLPVVVDNSADEFGEAMSTAFDFAATTRTRVVVVNAWNEWTEGSYLEADDRNGDAHARALRRAVDAHARAASTRAPQIG